MKTEELERKASGTAVEQPQLVGDQEETSTTRFAHAGNVPPVATETASKSKSASERGFDAPLSEAAAHDMQKNVGAVATKGSPVQRAYEALHQLRPWADENGISLQVMVQRVANGEPVHAWILATYKDGHTAHIGMDGSGPSAAPPLINWPEPTTVSPIGSPAGEVDVNSLPAPGAGGIGAKVLQLFGGGNGATVQTNDAYKRESDFVQHGDKKPEAPAATAASTAGSGQDTRLSTTIAGYTEAQVQAARDKLASLGNTNPNPQQLAFRLEQMKSLGQLP